MDARTFENSKLSSRQVTERARRVPQRCREDATVRPGVGECERLTVAITQCALDADRASRADHKSVAGKISQQNLENVKFNIDQKVVWLVSDPISGVGGAVGLQGSLAPDGALAKVAEMTELPFPEPAWVFGSGKAVHAVAKRRDADLGIGLSCQRQTNRPLDLDVCKADVVRRRAAWKAPVNLHQSGVLRIYADQVEPAREGAVSHAGGRAKSCL
ncbi:MAG TPA: dihydroxy-acid dehydratase [Hyphomicrobiaceae bacterium]|jgi:dihydroxyacid dehydratase/phosphogluconate dehydratase|nr:dihydroxy-acid dehydratase [Hyphomicrobiaceae bacterium]